MTEQETPSRCWMCGHPWQTHDPNPDGTRPCRSVGHPNGVPCADCRAMLTTEYRARLQDERAEDWFQTVWGAYTVTLDDARTAFGDTASAFFSDIHQSALASALIAYRQQQKEDAEKRLEAITEAVILWRDRPGGDVGLAIALAGILDTEQPEPPAATALVRVLKECDRLERAVRGNPTNPDFDGAYLAAIRHIRGAAAGVGQDGSGTADPRQPAYDAVFAYIHSQPRDFLPATVVDRNAMIWRAVHAALDAVGHPGAAKQEG